MHGTQNVPSSISVCKLIKEYFKEEAKDFFVCFLSWTIQEGQCSSSCSIFLFIDHKDSILLYRKELLKR